MKRYLILLLFIAVLQCHAQSDYLGFDRINTQTGLPENRVDDMLQDNEGYMWFTTQNGLARYDGYNIRTYRPGSEDKSNLSYLFFKILQDKKHDIWVCGINTGLFKYDVSAVYTFITYRSRKLMRDKKVLEHKVHVRTEEVIQQKEEIEAQRDSLDTALTELKGTQAQLVQSEKMASLGELTAGIAHEIQNPLNFVNNFSEVNREMIDELADELRSGNINDALAITADLKANEEKINHHGKRADSIIKSMLEHSRVSTGQKEPTDINKLADEYLRLAYHGLRAKDKSFNAELVNHFDENLPPINAIPQDIGRVMLNLFNNAFYAANQKAKTADNSYKPTVEISTAQQNGSVMISVKDNGNGIPDNIRDKIMQPFFTTKPTGEGTGLGLSLSYDIVVKGHGGSINISSREGDFTEFTVSLPL